MTQPAVFVDSSNLGTVNLLAESNATLVSPPTVTSHTDRFWSSPPKLKTDQTKETLEIDFSDSNLTNIITFQAAHFPQTIAVQYIPDGGSTWSNLLDATTGNPIVITIHDSYPAVLPSSAVITTETHPQHDFQGHWVDVNLDITPVEIRRVRFLIQRFSTGIPPVDRTGSPVPYSVALQNIYVGYEISKAAHVPRAAIRDDSLTTHEPFASTTDMFGSTVEFSQRVNFANNLMNNSDADAPHVWKSEPQPVPDAVVNFYADVRDSTGAAQVIDQILIDPLYNGPTINLYYSNDNPVSTFQSNTSYLNSLQGSVFGGAIVNPTNIDFGVYGTPSYIKINNAGVVNFDADEPWWVGVEFQPNFNVNVDALDHAIFACGSFQIGFNKTGIYFMTSAGDRNTVLGSYLNTSPIRVVASFENGLLHLAVRQDGVTAKNDILASVAFPDTFTDQLIIGSNVSGTKFSNSTLTQFVLRKENWPGDDFLLNPNSYTTIPDFSGTALSDQNMLLVFDPRNVTAVYPSGFRGGTSQRFDLLSWTPIAREFQMQRGALEFPATKAKFWNLEITNLQPQYTDVYVPVTRTVKKFPPAIVSDSSAAVSGTDRSNPLDLPSDVQASLYNAIPSSDRPLYLGTGGNPNGVSNTEVYVSTDIATSTNLSTSLGNEWKYQPLHANTTAPRFHSISVHNYATEDVTQTANITYACGLRQISFARTQIASLQNAPIYEEPFFDKTGIFGGNWIATGDGTISSGAAVYAQAQSVTFQTQRAVRAVQFAAQTTDNQQILPDSDLSDGSWSNIGDAQTLGIEPSTPGAEAALLVSRRVSLGFWGDIVPIYGPTWNTLDGHVTYGQLEIGTNTPQFFGGIQSESLATPNGGRLYAATRVVATEDLNAPITVQIVDTGTQAVLAQSSTTVAKNQVKEVVTSFDIATLGGVVGRTWGDLIGKKTWQTFTDNFARSNSASLGRFTTGQVWSTPTGGTSLSIASGVATATSGARSEFDAGTPWGTFSFTLGNAITTGTHSAAVPVADIGGMYVMNDSTIETNNISSTIFTLSSGLTAGHKYDFQFMPTSLVPGGQQVGGTDPSSQPYSVVVFNNNVWMMTYTGNRAFSSVRALMGAATQTFTAASWTPNSAIQVDPISQIFTLPTPSNLTQTSITPGQTYSWTDSLGRVWMYQGAYTYAASGLANSAKSLVPGTGFPSGTPAGTQTIVDVNEDYGALEFNVTQMPAGLTASNVVLAYLYYNPTNTHALTLMGDGSIYNSVTATTVKASQLTSATAGVITVRFAAVSSLTTAFKSTWSITTQKQAIITLQGNTVKGVYAGNSLWETTIRGTGGAAAGTGSTQYSIIEGFGWYSDANLLSTNTSATTWTQVSYANTRTYGDLEAKTAPSAANIAVQVLQNGITQDFWYVESAALFWDPLIWEFSCDAGTTWWKAIDVKNNPRGVLMFPYGLTTYSGLAWRVTSYAPNVVISHLAIRPWYVGGLGQGVPARPTQLQAGPNVVPQDNYSSIDNDPRWKVWRNPIPRWWYANFKKLTL